MQKTIRTLLAGVISLAGFVGISEQSANAQVIADSVSFEFAESQGVEERLTRNGINLLGDNIDPNTGTLTFEHTDVVLSGNSGLEVAFRRRISQGSIEKSVEQTGLGDWFMDVPTVSFTYIRPFRIENGGGFGFGGQLVNELTERPEISSFDCTPLLDGVYAIPYEDGTVIQHANVELDVSMFSRGLVVNIPGRYNNQSQSSQLSSSPWRGECHIQSNGEPEYTVRAPNGDTYKFHKHIYRKATLYNAALRQFVNDDNTGTGTSVQDPIVAQTPIPRDRPLRINHPSSGVQFHGSRSSICLFG